MSQAILIRLLPEAVLVAAAAAVIITALVRGGSGRIVSTVIGVAGVAASVVLQAFMSDDQTVMIGGMVAFDHMSSAFRLVFMAAAAVVLLSSPGSKDIDSHRYPEYVALVLLFSVGLGLVATAANLLMLYIAMEMISIIAYSLTAFDISRPRSGEAGLKYAIFGAVASGVSLFGVSIIYGLFGTLDYQALRVGMAQAATQGPQSLLLAMGLLFFLGGLMFKVAAVPFHAWCPDAYEGAPTPFTALMSVAPKAAGFAALCRFVWAVLSGPVTGDGSFAAMSGVPWIAVLGVVSALTMTLGNLSAIGQSNLKRMLAYSSIAHAGYVLMGVVALSREGFSAVIAYLVIYLVMNLGAFLCIIAAASFTGGEQIEDWRGMSRRNLPLAVCFGIFLLSLAGIPPLAGFVGKFYLFYAVIVTGGKWLWLLAVIGVLNSVISLYYYARILRAMFLFEPTAEALAQKACTARLNMAMLWLLAPITVILGVYWSPLIEFARRI
ncbi:MAG: NADH-quinone oxidoreductase subunit N [Myxococcota bacterium]